VTTRPVFGDFAAAASTHLSRAARPPGTGTTPAVAAVGNADDIARSLSRLLTVMTRYAADIEAATSRPRPERGKAGPWERAAVRAAEALRNAAEHLPPESAPAARARPPGRARQPDPAARRLDAAATALTVGRDLLQTHLATRPGGAPRDRSEWAPVILSPPVTRALLHEVGSWAGQLAPLGSQRALARAPAYGTPNARRQLAAASQWLWDLYWAVQSADEHDPLPTEHIDLLHAIPASALTPRHLPDGTEPVTRLCHGTITTAERVRHHARAAIPRASWSPALTMESVRGTADLATVISHNCQLLLATLVTSAEQHRAPSLAAQLAEAADAAGHARHAWLQAARAWDTLITDTRGTISRTARETADLALWTGRLAYASPAWTPGLGPGHAARPADQLISRPADLPTVVAAVHHAQDTLTQLAEADHSQLRTASVTGRLLLPAPALPEFFDSPYIFGPAPASSTEPLLAAYRDARTASARAFGRTGAVAEAVRAPSQVLTTARAATHASTSDPPAPKHRATEPSRPRPAANMPGLVERILHDLGITTPDVLQRATAIDHATEQLLLETAHEPGPTRPGAYRIDLSRSASTAEIITHMLASGDPRAAVLLRAPEPRRSAQAEIEP
jgi:hypothetical protein